MKRLIALSIFLITAVNLLAQKVDYKNDIITVEGKDIAKVVRIKDKANFGLTSTFELHSLSGEKLIIATVATDFTEPYNDNSSHYYRFSFLTANQVAIFTLNKLGTEKSFAKLIGQSGIVVDNQVDTKLLNEFIATKSKNPKATIQYDLVSRNRMMPLLIKKDNLINQGHITIGHFKDLSVYGSTLDTYEISLPTGLVIAKVSFTGGNNAQKCEIITFKTNTSQVVSVASNETTSMLVNAIDRNQVVLKRIAKWLVDNQYL